MGLSVTKDSGRFAFFGSKAPRLGFTSPPEGGFCISSFVLIRKSRSILLGKLAKSEEWERLTGMDEERVQTLAREQKWLIPASHLMFGEHPDHAAKRVLEEQLELRRYSSKLNSIQSSVGRTKRYPGRPHWDICFVYEARLSEQLKRPKWFSDLRYVNPRDLSPSDFGRDHEGVLQELGWLPT